jgi:hypothetical protein
VLTLLLKETGPAVRAEGRTLGMRA